jgi:hypothetical protein
MLTARQGLLPLSDLDPQQFETFVLSFLGAGISLEVIERPPKAIEGSSRAVRYRLIGATFFGGAGPAGQRGIDIKVTTETGAIWAFQCKHYATDFTVAKTKATITKAMEEFPAAARYFLVLSSEPRPDVRDQVEQHERWEIWGGSELSVRFFNEVDRSKQIEILQRIFPNRASDLINRLYPLRDDLLISTEGFFKIWINPDRIFHHRAQLVGRQDVLLSLHTLIRDPSVQAVILPAAGGVGKTRLLRAFGETFSAEHPEQHLLFIDSEARPDKGSNILRTARDGELVVVQDDAHRTESLRNEIITSLVEKNGKMVFATRPHAVDALTSWLARVGVDAGRIRVLPPLAPLKREERVALARECLPANAQEWAEPLADWAKGCTLVITVGAALIAQGKFNPQKTWTSEVFQRAVFDRLESESFADAIEKTKVPLARDILRLLATLAPWNEQVLPLDGMMAILGGCTIRDFQEIFDQFREARLLIQTRQGWRVIPDLFADHLVFRGCYGDDGKLTDFARRLQKGLGANATASILRNLAEAEWQAQLDNSSIASLLEPFWRQMQEDFVNANFFDRSQIIKTWARFSVLQPDRSLRLARLALDSTSAPPAPTEFLFNEFSESMYSYKTVLAALPPLLEPIATYHADFRCAALDLLWDTHKHHDNIDENAADGPLSAIGHAAKFRIRHPVEASQAVVDWLAAKLKGPDAGIFCDHPSPALAVILKPIFEHEVEDSFSDGPTFTFRNYPISVENTRGVRASALKILQELVIPRGEIATLNALSVLDAAIGVVRLRLTREAAAEFEKLWLPERRSALAIIEYLVTSNQSSRVLFRIFRLLRPLAIRDPQPEFRDDCARMLAKIPDSAGLRLTRILLSNAWSEFFHDTPHEEASVTDAEKRVIGEWQSLVNAAAAGIIAQHPATGLLVSFLNNTVADYCRVGTPPHCWELLNAVARVQPELAANCIDELLAKDATLVDQWWTALFSGQRQFPDERLIGWVKKVFRANNTVRHRALLSILGWAGIGEVPAQVLTEVAAWSCRLGDATLETALENLRWRDERKATIYNTILNNLDLSALSGKSLTRLAEALSNATGHNEFPLSSDFVIRFIRELGRVDRIDDHEDRSFIRQLSKLAPQAFFDMLEQRIREAETRRAAGQKFDPLRVGTSLPLTELPKAPDYRSLARKLFDTLRTADVKSKYWWQLLFQGAVLQVSPLGLELMKEWLPKVQTADELRDFIRTLHFEGSMIIFREPEFVRAILIRMRQLAPTDFERLRWSLGNTASPQIRGYIGHQLEPQFQYYREEAAKAAAIHERDSELAAFYREIVRNEDADAARHRREAELDAAEWQTT